MNRNDREGWKGEALDFILVAIAQDHELNDGLIFKGARLMYGRVTSMRRRSLDLDATIVRNSRAIESTVAETATWFSARLSKAIQRAAESEQPIRYALNGLTVTPSPNQLHPHGWQGFLVGIQFADRRRPGVLGFPKLEIDLAAPEELGPGAIETIEFMGTSLHAYTIARQAAEKLRAILQSLPAWRQKIGGAERSVRVKDMADLSSILSDHALSEAQFWATVASEFVAACHDRLVDCAGWETFAENVEVTARDYRNDANLRSEASFEDAWKALQLIVADLDRRGVFPIKNPLPE